MNNTILDGKSLYESIKLQVLSQRALWHLQPRLEVIAIGNSPDIESYIEEIEKDCLGVSFELIVTRLPVTANEREVICKIKDSTACGITIAQPLPEHLNENLIFQAIPRNKDVSCLNSVNLGSLFINESIYNPCSVLAVMDILWENKLSVSNKNCVILSKNNHLSKSMALALLNAGASVTACENTNENLDKFISMADLIIVNQEIQLLSAVAKKGVIVVDMLGKMNYESLVEVAEKIVTYESIKQVSRVVLLMNVNWAALKVM